MSVFSMPFLTSSDNGNENPLIPILSTGDFNGDGIINFWDVFSIAIAAAIQRDDAIYDLNADGKVNGTDIGLTVNNFGETSSILDRQLVDVYREVMPLLGPLGIGLAALEYSPFTQTFAGHGAHWISIEKVVEVLGKNKKSWTHKDYIGLNISPLEERSDFLGQEVLGVFYLEPPDNIEQLFQYFANEVSEFANGQDDTISWWDEDSGIEPEFGPPLNLFDDELTNPNHTEHWHAHEKVYVTRSTSNPWDSNAVNFQQNLTDTELTQMVKEALLDDTRVLWGIETGGFDYSTLRSATDIALPMFRMMHVWINELSSGSYGIFDETNQNVAIGYPELPSHGSGHHMM